IIAPTGSALVDAGIMGNPPRPGAKGPVIYASGPEAKSFAVLAQHGLDIRIMKGGIGQASALKLSYAGMPNGLTALASAMLLPASRAGVADELRAELADSQPDFLARFQPGIPSMFPKAYRWIAEMEQIAEFAGPAQHADGIYENIARLYEAIAR